MLSASEPPGMLPDAHNKHSINISDDYDAKILALKAARFIVGQLGLLFPIHYSGMKSAFQQTDLLPTRRGFISHLLQHRRLDSSRGRLMVESPPALRLSLLLCPLPSDFSCPDLESIFPSCDSEVAL